MASLIHCPHCGVRPKEEFVIRGAALHRPDAEATFDAWFRYVYLRENPRGALDEHWHHSGGCRRWLIVTRDALTHEQISVRDVADAGARA